MKLRILSRSDVQSALSMPAAIQAMREGFTALSTGRATVPLRTPLETPDGVTLLMPAHIEADGAGFSAVKIVSVFHGNAVRGLPIIHAGVLVIDAGTGRLQALMDGTWLTALRTGAGGGLAADLLSRPESCVMGVIGAGVQARTQIMGVLAVRPIQEVRIYSRGGGNQALCAELTEQYPTVRFIAPDSVREALREADIWVAATTSATPVIDPTELRPGVHITGVGSYAPTLQEVSSEVIQRAKVVVDSRVACLAESGDLIIPIGRREWSADRIHAEIGEIAAGLKPGRQSADEITFFKSVGNAVQDAAAAAQVLKVAEAQNLGTLVELS